VSRGGRVIVRPPEAADADDYLERMRASRAFHRPWIVAPTDRASWDRLMERHATEQVEVLFAVRRADAAIVGTFVLSQIFYGQFRNAYLGFWATAGHERRGYMTEGMHGVLRHAFRTLRLHRVEANVQPGNAASLALVRRCGFRHEGFSPRYLKVAGRWRDHERFAIVADEWRPGSH
jgi:[ribosomal protein S5]-alanine N-acetyltransferase